MKIYGKNHHSIAKSQNNLGLIYYKTGNCTLFLNEINWLSIFIDKESLKLYKQALKIRIETFGEYHDETIRIYNSMASVYEKTGDFDKSKLYRNKNFEKVWLCFKVYSRICV
jgi:hypothetical protein